MNRVLQFFRHFFSCFISYSHIIPKCNLIEIEIRRFVEYFCENSQKIKHFLREKVRFSLSIKMRLCYFFEPSLSQPNSLLAEKQQKLSKVQEIRENRAKFSTKKRTECNFVIRLEMNLQEQ